MQSKFTKSSLLSIALVAGATSVLSAQERLFEWTGRVDREVRVVMRGSDVWTQDVSGRDSRRTRARVSRALPAQAGQVRVQLLDGRGDVSVIQQPSRRNNYTAIVRIYDRSGGADRYRLAAYWRPIGGGRWGGDDRGDVGDRYDYGSGMLRWSGAVDDQVEIRIQGRNVDTRTLSGNGARDVRANLNGRALPRRDVTVSVRERSGRGTVSVVQQPSQWNGYTAVIRVRDRQGGFGFYDFDVSW
ncbi:MAG: hypothetical protein ABR499_20790 [Gemmatimonadaceae bacterium]